MTLFGIPAMIAEQDAIVKKYCFDICGKLVIGGIDGGDVIGCLYVCQQSPDNCMCFDRQTEKPVGEVEGKLIYIRKLKERGIKWKIWLKNHLLK
jgi:hypothetical protein